MLHVRTFFTALAVLATAAAGLSQRVPQAVPLRVLPAPPQLCQQFDTMAGTVQDLQLPQGQPAAVLVDVSFAGVVRRLELTLHDVRAPGFQLLERTAAGLQPLPTPACVTYQGAVQGDAGSVAAATLVGGSMTAFVRLSSGDLWIVQPVREVNPAVGPAAHFVFRSIDSLNLGAVCGVGGVLGQVPDVQQEDVLYACQIAIEADRPYYLANGSNVTATQNDITGVVNAMDTIYRRDVQITFQVVQIIVDTTSDPYTTNVANQLLNQFGGYWNANHGGIARDVAHLFTGRPMGASSGGAIGIATLSTICNVGSAYGISQSRFTANFSYRVAVTAHEIGHNFGAQHCDGANPCNIMCSGVGGCNNNPSAFGPSEQSQIIGFRQAIGCLSLVYTTPVITNTNPVQIKAYHPQIVTLTGTGFLGTTSITVGGTVLNTGIQVLSDSQLRFTPPAGLALGVQTFTVTNNVGSSTPAALIYQSVNPCEMFVPTAVIGGNTLTWAMGGTPNDFAYLLISLVNTTSPYLGLPLLDGSSVLWTQVLDSRGIGGFSIPVPAGVLNGVRAYSQMFAIQGGTLTPRSTSAVYSTLVVL